jgi:hypothetical protein
MKIMHFTNSQLFLILITGIICLYSLPVMACDACKKQQPAFLQGITHGSGPDSNWDYLIISVMTAITLYSLYATMKCIFQPSEKDSQHIKRIILNQ